MADLRREIAAVAARLIVDSGLTDWQLARRKALDHLGLPNRGTPLPDDALIIAALREHLHLFGGETWRQQLHDQRITAFEVMQALERFQPRLTGPVAEGWAHAGSEIRIELECESEKEIDYALIDLGAEYEAVRLRDGGTAFLIADTDWPVRLVLRAPARTFSTRTAIKLDLEDLRQLLITEASQNGVSQRSRTR